jgi:hypothetical protein
MNFLNILNLANGDEWLIIDVEEEYCSSSNRKRWVRPISAMKHFLLVLSVNCYAEVTSVEEQNRHVLAGQNPI